VVSCLPSALISAQPSPRLNLPWKRSFRSKLTRNERSTSWARQHDAAGPREGNRGGRKRTSPSSRVRKRSITVKPSRNFELRISNREFRPLFKSEIRNRKFEIKVYGHQETYTNITGTTLPNLSH